MQVNGRVNAYLRNMKSTKALPRNPTAIIRMYRQAMVVWALGVGGSARSHTRLIAPRNGASIGPSYPEMAV